MPKRAPEPTEVDDMEVKPGTRLKSAVCTTEVVVVRAPDHDVDLRCGGQPMVQMGDESPLGSVDPAYGSGTQLGKRYADADSGLEVLCTKAGEGSLSLADAPILLKDAKPLPSSD
jgi:hypothetical protein